ncbi:hypothetical protein CKO_00544 [Citrobacter koseri ATCC BAA-895]|uniref:Uncharacterized protein n=1 Tax=Citrobacter koseri (strain ATCC BAA-895 / CDC 4225-83 / SGSC4696) TaxID=290338 RepID=A8ADY8_CITK8|nr:hypothetical protein CKO_00544 [Citrobacter koseri ATCC BAA-895]
MALVVASAPLKLPIAVRAALTMTQFFIFCSLKVRGCRQKKVKPMTKMIPEKSRAVMQ